MTENLENLRAKLRRYQESYYNLTPEVNDSEYDALVTLIKSMSPEVPELKTVGAPVPTHSVWEKVQHKIPMGSLEKVNSEKEFDEWVTKTNAETFFITHKIDGSSMELVYEKGILTQCVSRGDGTIGEEVSHNILKVPNIPHELPRPLNIVVRGEIVMYKEVFDRLYAEEYANPRNTAAGKVREKKNNGEDCVNLAFLAYRLYGDHKSIPLYSVPHSMSAMFEKLNQFGFQTPEYSIGDSNAMKSVFSNTKRNEIPYEIDGLVISIEDIQMLEELGDLNMRPRGQIAWKFESETGITTLENVKWQVGHSGRITPVAIVKPIEIGGVTITNVSLHNLAFFSNLKLFKGCRVLVARKNDVIPYICQNIDNESDI